LCGFEVEGMQVCCERVAQVWVWNGPAMRVFRQVCTLDGHAGFVYSVT